VTAGDLRWADPVQRLAVQAATAEPAVALDAWRQLTDRVDLADLWDDEVYRLLPRVWARLGGEVGAEHHDLLKGLYRRAWVANQHHVRHAADLLPRLDEAGVDAVLLGGVALTLLVHGDLGIRPAKELDLLVRSGDAVVTWGLLREQGYRPVPARRPAPSRWQRPEADDDWYRTTQPARAFRRDGLDHVVVHTAIDRDLLRSDPSSDDEAFRADAAPVPVGDVEGRVLAPAHQLLHTLLSGVGAYDRTGLQWIPDALDLLEARDDLDWSAFTAAVDRHHLHVRTSEAVDHLVTSWSAPVPARVVTHLAGGADRRQRLVHGIRRRAGARFPKAGDAVALHLTRSEGRGLVGTVADTPAFLVDHWQVAERRHLPLVAAHRARAGARDLARRVAHRLRPRRPR
jgi:hypothetical protein